MQDFFSLYTNYSQYNNALRDRYNRDRYYNSYNQDIFEPVLSKQIQQNGFNPYYPDNKKLAVCISHDIDHLFEQRTNTRKFISTSKYLLKGRFDAANNVMKSIIKKQIAPQYSLEALSKINKEFDVKSSYYFLSLQKGEEDYNYDVRELKTQFKSILAQNNEIGLHGGHLAYNDLNKILAEKENLQSNISGELKGYRNHYLRFQLPLSWNKIAEAGFIYDTTYAYADCSGFRNGMCYPFYPYDVEKKKFIELIELPLMAMDATLFYYMRLDKSSCLKLCKKLIENVKTCNGVFTLLWHNNFLGGEMGDTYKAILNLLNEYDPWFTTSVDLVEWWRNEKLIEQSQAIVEKLMFR